MHFSVEDKVYRAIPGGTGGIKSITNYSPVSTTSSIFTRNTIRS